MPPDITAGLMPAAGKIPATGPPGALTPGTAIPVTGTLSASLFAALLAQSGTPTPKASVRASAILQPPALPETTAQPVLQTPALKTAALQTPALRTGDPLPVLTPPQEALPKVKQRVGLTQSIELRQTTSGSLKTMDTSPKLSLLPTEKAKDKASELPLHQISADMPSTLPAAPVQTPALPSFVPVGLNVMVPVSFISPAFVAPASVASVPVSATPSASVMEALPPVQAALASGTIMGVSPVAGLVLPRTFALTASASTSPSVPLAGSLPVPELLSFPSPVTSLPSAASTPLVASLPSVTSAPLVISALSVRSLPPDISLPSAGSLPPTKSLPPVTPLPSDSRTLVLSAPVLMSVPSGHVLPRPISASPTVPTIGQSKNSEQPPMNVEMAAAVPDTVGSAPVMSQEPAAAAPLLPVTALSAPETVAAISSLAPSSAGPVPAAPAPAFGKIVGKSVETALKPPAQNADNNTRTSPVENSPAAAKAAPAITAPITLPEPTASRSGKHAEEPLAQTTETTQANTVGTAALVTVTGAAQPESKPLSAAERAEVVRQVANGVGTMPLPTRPGAAEQISLQLHPKDWGQLQVSVSVVPSTVSGAAKTVTAHIVAETPQVKAALESQTGALHQALRASGLHLEHLTVSVKPPDTKTAEVKPAAQSASAGMSSGQSNTGGQSGANGQGNTNRDTGQAQAGQSSTSASFAGSSQNGQQGPHPRTFAAAAMTAEPEPEETVRGTMPLRSAAGRIDTHA